MASCQNQLAQLNRLCSCMQISHDPLFAASDSPSVAKCGRCDTCLNEGK